MGIINELRECAVVDKTAKNSFVEKSMDEKETKNQNLYDFVVNIFKTERNVFISEVENEIIILSAGRFELFKTLIKVISTDKIYLETNIRNIIERYLIEVVKNKFLANCVIRNLIDLFSEDNLVEFRREVIDVIGRVIPLKSMLENCVESVCSIFKKYHDVIKFGSKINLVYVAEHIQPLSSKHNYNDFAIIYDKFQMEEYVYYMNYVIDKNIFNCKKLDEMIYYAKVFAGNLPMDFYEVLTEKALRATKKVKMLLDTILVGLATIYNMDESYRCEIYNRVGNLLTKFNKKFEPFIVNFANVNMHGLLADYKRSAKE